MREAKAITSEVVVILRWKCTKGALRKHRHADGKRSPGVASKTIVQIGRRGQKTYKAHGRAGGNRFKLSYRAQKHSALCVYVYGLRVYICVLKLE